MRRLAVVAAALVFAAGAIANSPEAEARRGWGGVGAGIVAAAVIGGIIAASASRRSYGYGYGYGYAPRSYYGPSYYSYGTPYYGYSRSYYRPVYAYRPVRVHRVVHYHRPVRFHRAGFVGGRGHFRGGFRRR